MMDQASGWVSRDKRHTQDLFQAELLELLPEEEVLESIPKAFVDEFLGEYDTEHKKTWFTALEAIQHIAVEGLKIGWSADDVTVLSMNLRLEWSREELSRQKKLNEVFSKVLAGLSESHRDRSQREYDSHIKNLKTQLQRQKLQNFTFIEDKSQRELVRENEGAMTSIAEEMIALLEERVEMIKAASGR